MQGFKDAGDFYAHVHKDLDDYRQFAKTVDHQDLTKLTAAEAYATGKALYKRYDFAGAAARLDRAANAPDTQPEIRESALMGFATAEVQLGNFGSARSAAQTVVDTTKNADQKERAELLVAEIALSENKPGEALAAYKQFAEGTSEVAVPRRRSRTSSPDSRPPSRSHEAIRARPRRARRRGSDARRGRRTARSEDAAEGAGVARRRGVGARNAHRPCPARDRMARQQSQAVRGLPDRHGDQARAVRGRAIRGAPLPGGQAPEVRLLAGHSALGLRRASSSSKFPSSGPAAAPPAISGSIEYQTCNDSQCLAPASRPVPLGARRVPSGRRRSLGLPDRRRRPPVGGPPAGGLRPPPPGRRRTSATS